jgi:hypothetical protein
MKIFPCFKIGVMSSVRGVLCWFYLEFDSCTAIILEQHNGISCGCSVNTG